VSVFDEGRVRERVERSLGERIPPTRIEHDQSLNESTTLGGDVTLAGTARPGSLSWELVLAHELAHAAEQTGTGAPLPAWQAEAQADSAALRSVLGLPARAGLARGGPALRRCEEQSEFDRILSGRTISAADARKVLGRWRTLAADERRSAFDRYYSSGAVTRLLAAVTAADASGPYRAEVQDILRRVQETATARAAGETEAKMAQRQADFMRARDLAAAQATTGSAAPTAAEVEHEHREAVEQQSSIQVSPPVSRWAGLSAADQASWTARGNAAITAFVAHARTHHPELNVTAAEIVLDYHGVEMEGGANAQAFTRDYMGRPRAHVGFAWVELVEADPAYGTSIIVHELRGHPQYESWTGTYPLVLYRKAAARARYARPAPGSPEELQEIRTYGYEDTEMYSLLRSQPYHTAVRPAHAAAVGQYEIEPERAVRWHIQQIRTQWEPRIANAILAGFYQRLRHDPRIAASALETYRRAVRAELPAAEAATVLR
jgi:Domain of unknown function (DUF4157)